MIEQPGRWQGIVASVWILLVALAFFAPYALAFFAPNTGIALPDLTAGYGLFLLLTVVVVALQILQGRESSRTITAEPNVVLNRDAVKEKHTVGADEKAEVGTNTKRKPGKAKRK